MIKPAIKFTKIVRKAFSNDCYDLELSNYYQFSYCVVGFKESIRLTESWAVMVSINAFQLLLGIDKREACLLKSASFFAGFYGFS